MELLLSDNMLIERLASPPSSEGATPPSHQRVLFQLEVFHFEVLDEDLLQCLSLFISYLELCPFGHSAAADAGAGPLPCRCMSQLRLPPGRDP